MALITAAILLALGSTTFVSLQDKYRVVHQAASWKEALLTAEGGVEMAMNEIRKQLFTPSESWQGWSRSSDDATKSFTSRTLIRRGEGGQRSWAEVTVEAPPFLRDHDGEQWFRVRSVGVAEVPGGAFAAGNREDIRLRKLDLVMNRRTGRRVLVPQSTRMVEAIIKPVSAFRLALLATASIDMTSHNIVVDSYDSRDPAKSTLGTYDPLKRQENGDVATNGQLVDAGGAHIYGDVMTNGGTVLEADNVSGEIRDDFYQEIFPVTPPASEPDASSPPNIVGATVLNAQPETPSSYFFSAVTLTNNESLRVKGAADGSPTYCQMVISGDAALSGQAQIKLDPGVYLRIFIKGDADFSGQGFANPNPPLNLQLYGCDRPKAADGTILYGKIRIVGSSGFSGAVYAPTYDIEMKGGGSTDTIFGSFVGHEITLNGVQSVHYDEAMADGGLVSDYKIVSWFEDER